MSSDRFAEENEARQITISRLASASRTVASFTRELLAIPGLPILDAGGGYGRNAALLAREGAWVICADRDLERMTALARYGLPHLKARGELQIGSIQPLCAELTPERWPFTEDCLSAVLCVHFVSLSLIHRIHSSLVGGGCFLFETFGGQGENYLALPKTGQMRELLSGRFRIVSLKEKRVGPAAFDAVSVRLLATKTHGPV